MPPLSSDIEYAESGSGPALLFVSGAFSTNRLHAKLGAFHGNRKKPVRSRSNPKPSLSGHSRSGGRGDMFGLLPYSQKEMIHAGELDGCADRDDGSCTRSKPACHTDLADGAKGRRNRSVAPLLGDPISIFSELA
jgi:hypothetical protein